MTPQSQNAFCLKLYDDGHMAVTYEELVQSPEQLSEKVGIFSGLDLSEWTSKDPNIKKQANSLNVEFRELYVADHKKIVLGE